MTDNLHTWGFDQRNNVYHARGSYDTYCGAPMRPLRGNMLATSNMMRRITRDTDTKVCPRCEKNMEHETERGNT